MLSRKTTRLAAVLILLGLLAGGCIGEPLGLDECDDDRACIDADLHCVAPSGDVLCERSTGCDEGTCLPREVDDVWICSYGCGSFAAGLFDECPDRHFCNSHGVCERRACDQSDDCTLGHCVGGFCHDTPGSCEDSP